MPCKWQPTANRYIKPSTCRGGASDFPWQRFASDKRGEKNMNIVWFILVGLIAGWLAGQLMKGGGFGVIGDIVVGIIGALIGGLLFSSLGISAGGGLLGAIIVATIGAVVLIALLRLIRRA